MSILETGKRVGGGALAFVRRFWIPIAILIVVIIGARMMFGGKPQDPYRTAAVDRGTITRVVSATGTLQPLVSVNVGSTVSGPVLAVNVDYNAHVSAGQVLARLDPTSFQQRVVQAQATLSQAQAQLAVANADYERYDRLAQAGFASQQLMSQQRAARDTARAAVSQAAASVASARTDLDRSVIKSPINGVVVDRQVNVGQSVAASFQAPTLFVIAQDLSRLQANITVDEADIGEVREGQDVHFTVDAFPDAEFDGRVSQVRQQGVDTSGVVSYTVVVQADNPGGRLLPGMTANAEIVIDRTDNVLRLPNTALRFRPADPALVAQAQALTGGRNGGSGQRGGRQRSGDGAQAGGGGGGGQGGGFGGGQGGRGGGAARGVAMLTEQLQLTPQQQAQATAAFTAAAASAGPRPDQDASQSDRRAYMRRVREAAMTQIEPILTAHQKELLAQVRANAAAGRTQVQTRQAVAWVLRNNKPAPVRVTIGVADNTNTAVVGGDLHEGDQVIIGGGPRSTTSTTQQRGPGGPGGFGGPGIRIRG